MKSLCFIVCYIGELPSYVDLWFNSCKNNSSVDFFLFTDDKRKYAVPDNVKINTMNLDEMKKRFSKGLEFNITLETAYKLCDYKPAYGEAFQDYISDYDYWGYCDLDIIWGNIRKFITDDILEKYMRILTRGHCSIFKNNSYTNSLYRNLEVDGCQKYSDVYSSNFSFCYDEWAGHKGGGLSQIFLKSNISQYDERIFLDPIFLKANFSFINDELTDINKCVVHFRSGKLECIYELNGYKGYKEYMYFHFQKRSPIIEWKQVEVDNFYFLPPNRVKTISNISRFEVLNQNGRFRGIYFFMVKFRYKQVKKKLYEIFNSYF